MDCRQLVTAMTGCAIAMGAWAPVRAQAPAVPASNARSAAVPIGPTAVVRFPLDEVPADLREKVRGVVERPTLCTKGPVEAFSCQPRIYYWLLDHPDLAVRLWHGLGIACADIQDKGEGRFSWQDGQGSTLIWSTIVNTASQRVWYAEGQVKPGLLLPATDVRAVVCLRHREGHDEDGRSAIRHQAELHLQTDSRVVALAARLFGASAPHLAEQYTGQIQTFYAGLAWYLEQNPEKARSLFAEIRREPARRPEGQAPATKPVAVPLPAKG